MHSMEPEYKMFSSKGQRPIYDVTSAEKSTVLWFDSVENLSQRMSI